MVHGASPLIYKNDKTNNIWLGNNILENGVKKRLLNLASLPPILPVLN